jgi:hypothetical protein
MRYLYLDEVALTLCLYLCYVGALTLAPFDFTLPSRAHSTFVAGNIWGTDGVFNILGFVPFGSLLCWLARPTADNLLAKWGFTTGAAATLSLAIETAQLFLPGRVPSYSDLLANTLGGGLGFWLAYCLHQQPWLTYLTRYRRRLALLSLAGYVGALTGLLLWAALPQRLDTWAPYYPLLIGNEATRNRPWLGKLFLIGLYDRALTAAEVLSQFQAGPDFEPAVHLPGRPIALYTFQEGGGRRVYDRSPVGPSLDLEIAEPHRAVWLPKGGLELTGPTLLYSTQQPDLIYQRATAGHTFSVAAWVEPKDALQHGPARIVSFSLNSQLRNFTLGQAASEIDFRVRTPLAGPNGTRGHFQTKGLGLVPQLTHLVAVYARETTELYVNGVRFPGGVPGDGLTVIAQMLALDASSRWQRGLVVVLLLGSVAGAVWALRLAGVKQGTRAQGTA